MSILILRSSGPFIAPRDWPGVATVEVIGGGGGGATDSGGQPGERVVVHGVEIKGGELVSIGAGGAAGMDGEATSFVGIKARGGRAGFGGPEGGGSGGSGVVILTYTERQP